MKKTFLIMLILLLVLFVSSCSTDSVQNQNDDPEVTPQILESTEKNIANSPGIFSDDAIAPDSIVYLGAFLLPDDGDTEQEMFSYGGEAICYNTANDSMFITGHNWHTFVAEITIPKPIISKEMTQMNKAEIINGFADIKGDLFGKWTMEIPRVGMEVVGDNLYFCFGEHFEEDTQLGTHGYTNLNLSASSKVCIAGDNLYSTNDYMFSIPDIYKDDFANNDLLTGRFRDGGWSGMGPSLFAISIEDIKNAKNNELISATAVVKYEDSFNGDDGYKMNEYSHADAWTGGAFISCEAGSAISFVGTHSYSKTWYGFSNGVVYPVDGDEDALYPEVPPYPHDERGWWSDDFRACIVLYDVEEAIKVLNKEIEPFEIQPYAFLDLSEYMMVKRDETIMQYLGGAAYDISSNRLYILELFADESKPVVHVFTFK